MAQSVIGALRVNLGLNSAQFQQGLKKSERSVRGFQSRMSRVFAGLAAVGALGGLSTAVKRVVDDLDEIGKTADKLGVTTDSLQELRFAAELTGVGTKTLDLSLQRFTRRTAEAAKGTGEAKAALEQMGIQLRDSEGRLRSTDELLGDVAEAFANTEDPAERLRLAVKLFDTEGAAMVNTLARGRDELNRMREEARRLGLVIDESLIRRAEEAQDQLTILSKVLSAQVTVALAQLLPLLIDLAQFFLDFASNVGVATRALREFAGLQLPGLSVGQSTAAREMERLTNRATELDRSLEALREGGSPSLLLRTLGVDETTSFDELFSKVQAERERIEAAQREAAQTLSQGATDLVPTAPVSLPDGGGGGGGGGGRSRAETSIETETALDRQIESIRQATSETQRLTEAQSHLNPLVKDFGFSAAAAEAEVALLNAAEESGVAVTPELAAKIRELAEAYGKAEANANKLAETQDQARESLEGVRDASREALTTLVSGLSDAIENGESFLSVLARIAEQILNMPAVQEALFGFNFQGTSQSTSGGGLLGSLASSIFGGGSGASLSNTGNAFGASGSLFSSQGSSLATSTVALPELFNFNQGGSFKVTGTGGIDKNIVAFKASRGEEITIKPVGEVRRETSGATERGLDLPGALPGGATDNLRPISLNLPKFNEGGKFKVAGSGGIDRNLVAFRASRGEEITIKPAGEVRRERPERGAFGRRGGDRPGLERILPKGMTDNLRPISLDLPKFNVGGSFRVQGVGGVDNNVVAFMASAGERVDITPRGQTADSGAVTIQQTLNFTDAKGARESAGTVARRTAEAVRRGRQYS